MNAIERATADAPDSDLARTLAQPSAAEIADMLELARAYRASIDTVDDAAFGLTAQAADLTVPEIRAQACATADRLAAVLRVWQESPADRRVEAIETLRAHDPMVAIELHLAAEKSGHFAGPASLWAPLWGSLIVECVLRGRNDLGIPVLAAIHAIYGDRVAGAPA